MYGVGCYTEWHNEKCRSRLSMQTFYIKTMMFAKMNTFLAQPVNGFSSTKLILNVNFLQSALDSL